MIHWSRQAGGNANNIACSAGDPLGDLMNHAKRTPTDYRARLKVTALRRAVFEQTDPASSAELLTALGHAEIEAAALEQGRAATASDTGPGDDHVDGDSRFEIRGEATTGLDVRVALRMAQLPTSICHLFDKADHPLVSCTIKNKSERSRRLRVTSVVDGYSAQAVDTVEIGTYAELTIGQLPTLFPDRLTALHELSGATVNVLVEDLDGRIETHLTEVVPLLARQAAPIAMRDPSTGRWMDLSRYLGAFVTPNAPAIMAFLRMVANHAPQGHLIGYQAGQSAVDQQLKAIFDALKAAGITYINSLVAFSPDHGTATQRIRTPAESLSDKEANCIDGTVLVASLLEACCLSAALVIVPGHAFVGCETREGSGSWMYLETTMIGSATFEEARASAEKLAGHYVQLKKSTGDEAQFRLWSLSELRSVHHITPME